MLHHYTETLVMLISNTDRYIDILLLFRLTRAGTFSKDTRIRPWFPVRSWKYRPDAHLFKAKNQLWHCVQLQPTQTCSYKKERKEISALLLFFFHRAWTTGKCFDVLCRQQAFDLQCFHFVKITRLNMFRFSIWTSFLLIFG